MKNNLSLILILSSLFCSVFAQEDSKDFTYDPETQSVKPSYLGKVILIKGSISSLSKEGKKKALKKESKIFAGDTLMTEARSMVKVEMIDTTVLTVAPKSEFKFDKWDYKTKEERSAVFQVLKGKIRSNIKVKSRKKGSLEYKVGSVSMGIRGTRILANYYKRRDNVTVSHVVVLTGKTEIYDSANDQSLELNAGSQYISFLKQDGTILKSEQSSLSQNQLKELKANDKNPNKYFKPFLPSITSKDLQSSNTQNQALKKTKSKNYQRRMKPESKKSWKSTLKKLNNRLGEEDD